jgi:hypothetical protein
VDISHSIPNTHFEVFWAFSILERARAVYESFDRTKAPFRIAHSRFDCAFIRYVELDCFDLQDSCSFGSRFKIAIRYHYTPILAQKIRDCLTNTARRASD